VTGNTPFRASDSLRDIRMTTCALAAQLCRPHQQGTALKSVLFSARRHCGRPGSPGRNALAASACLPAPATGPGQATAPPAGRGRGSVGAKARSPLIGPGAEGRLRSAAPYLRG